MKIQNTTQSSKRIRLTALDSAMSNIDDSTGAVAKVGREVLLCLSKAAAVQGIAPQLIYKSLADNSLATTGYSSIYHQPTLAEVYEGLVGGKESILATPNSVTANIVDNGLGPIPHRFPIDPLVEEGYDLFLAEYTVDLGYLTDNKYIQGRLADVNDTLPILGVEVDGQIISWTRVDLLMEGEEMEYTSDGDVFLGQCEIKIGGSNGHETSMTSHLYDYDGVTIKSSMTIESSRVLAHNTNGNVTPLPAEGLQFGFVGETPEGLMWSWNEFNKPGSWSVWRRSEIIGQTAWNRLSAELDGGTHGYADLTIVGDNTFLLKWLEGVPEGVVEDGFVITMTYPIYDGVEAPEFFCDYPHIVKQYNGCVRLQIYVPRVVTASQPQ